MNFRRLLYATGFVAVLASVAIPADAQFTCNNFVAINFPVWAERANEQVGDITFICSANGQPPTTPGSIVPSVNIRVSANTNITSNILATITPGGNISTSFNEALLIIDEPNTTRYDAGRALTNCGYNGEDSGPDGPGVCHIIAPANPSQTYDGAVGVFSNGTVDVPCVHASDFGCGRPNVFQARNVVSLISGQSNAIQFLEVPFDPPTSTTVRTVRITNIRVDATRFGVSSPFSTVPVTATISFGGGTTISVPDTTVTVAQVQQGMTTSSFKGPRNIRVEENFATAWKVKNVAATLANGTFNGSQYLYNGATISPISDDAQNVPGALYFSESGLENSPLAIVPVPNPPDGFGLGSVVNVGRAFRSLSGTGVEAAGVVSHGTLIDVKVPGGLVPPQVVALRNQSNNQQTGVMVLVGGSAAKHVAEYEILFSQPGALEYADIILAKR